MHDPLVGRRNGSVPGFIVSSSKGCGHHRHRGFAFDMTFVPWFVRGVPRVQYGTSEIIMGDNAASVFVLRHERTTLYR